MFFRNRKRQPDEPDQPQEQQRLPRTAIRLTCQNCYQATTLSTKLIRLLMLAYDKGLLIFQCPQCRYRNSHTSDREMIDAYLQRGVIPEMWDIPAEALEQKAGPRLEVDDVCDFILEMRVSDDYLVALIAQPAR